MAGGRLQFQRVTAPDFAGTASILRDSANHLDKGLASAKGIMDQYREGEQEKVDSSILQEMNKIKTEEQADAFFNSEAIAGRTLSPVVQKQMGALRQKLITEKGGRIQNTGREASNAGQVLLNEQQRFSNQNMAADRDRAVRKDNAGIALLETQNVGAGTANEIAAGELAFQGDKQQMVRDESAASVAARNAATQASTLAGKFSEAQLNALPEQQRQELEKFNADMEQAKIVREKAQLELDAFPEREDLRKRLAEAQAKEAESQANFADRIAQSGLDTDASRRAASRAQQQLAANSDRRSQTVFNQNQADKAEQDLKADQWEMQREQIDAGLSAMYDDPSLAKEDIAQNLYEGNLLRTNGEIDPRKVKYAEDQLGVFLGSQTGQAAYPTQELDPRQVQAATELAQVEQEKATVNERSSLQFLAGQYDDPDAAKTLRDSTGLDESWFPFGVGTWSREEVDQKVMSVASKYGIEYPVAAAAVAQAVQNKSWVPGKSINDGKIEELVLKSLDPDANSRIKRQKSNADSLTATAAARVKELTDLQNQMIRYQRRNQEVPPGLVLREQQIKMQIEADNDSGYRR